jgi:hypothetical protein
MDYKNQSIPVEKITSFDVNKAIQRSLTKAVARHGLGLYIYAGEDLPEGENQPEPQFDEKLLEECREVNLDLKGLAVYLKKNYCNLTNDDLRKGIAMKRRKQ